MIKTIIYCLTPLAVLIGCIVTACIVGFGLLWGLGDVLSIERMVNKGTQLFLVLSLFPLKNLFQLSWSELGFNGKVLFYKQMGQGLVAGVLILGPIILILYALDVRLLKPDKVWTITQILKMFAGSLAAALAISLLEEPVFRGLLLTTMRRKLSIMLAISVSACYYAGLHFLKTDQDVPYEQLHWYSAFELVTDALSNPFQLQNIPSFSALFLVGVFLGLARLHAGLGLGFCIGCHTAWVFLIKITKSMSNVDVDNPFFFLVSHYDGVIGFLVSAWLMLGISVYWKLNQNRATE